MLVHSPRTKNPAPNPTNLLPTKNEIKKYIQRKKKFIEKTNISSSSGSSERNHSKTLEECQVRNLFLKGAWGAPEYFKIDWNFIIPQPRDANKEGVIHD